MISLAEILSNDSFDLSKALRDSEKYLAHTNVKTKETLVDHTKLTLDYFRRLCEANRLEPVIDHLIDTIVRSNIPDPQCKVLDLVKRMFVESVYFHDFGKVNENFQVEKMENPVFGRVQNGIRSEHSILSSVLFLVAQLRRIREAGFTDEENNWVCLMAYLFSYPILRHHGQMIAPLDYEFDREAVSRLVLYPELFETCRGGKVEEVLTLSEWRFSPDPTKLTFEKLLREMAEPFSLFALLRLNSSLLTAADYYATNEFMVGIECSDFGVLDEKLVGKITDAMWSVPYNLDLKEREQFFRNLAFENISTRSEMNLNLLRQKLSAEVLAVLRDSAKQRLFYIEAPTGSGKTNLSFLVVGELLKHRQHATKVFYVFPFTTLITQTLDSIKKTLGLTSAEVAAIHSKALFNIEDEQGDDDYGVKRRNYIDNLFVNYPIVLVSHVRFFDILVSNEKELTYLFHRIPNSIVIVDEIQSYSPTEWDKVSYILQNVANYLNVTFVVMSATLPKISKLVISPQQKDDDKFVHLVTNRKQYYQNPNFRERITFRFDYLDKHISWEELARIVHRHSEQYYAQHGRVKAIIECVTKKSAHKLFEIIENMAELSDYVKLILSGTILEPRRQDIVRFLKSDDANKGRILLVTTQVIEAGMDIDMDLGFKDKSILDSEEQLAGRINRNAAKPRSDLFLFNSSDSVRTYRRDLRHRLHLDLQTYKEILLSKDFDRFYDLILDSINHANKDQFMASTAVDFQTNVRVLQYQTVNDQFELIRDNTVSVFVPLELEARHFTEQELSFLGYLAKHVVDADMVRGDGVWTAYCNLIENKSVGFIDKRINLKMMSSILAKYSFSMWNNPQQINILRSYTDTAEAKYGFYNLQHYAEIYSYEKGLKAEIETDSNFF
jgi:CRISPR-associated endonuclease/helicase Cas3